MSLFDLVRKITEKSTSITPEPFNNYTLQHREHQKNALKALESENKGQIIIPTGTGKTRVQVSVHIQDMLNKSKNNKTGVYVIAAHRLLLCKQLMDELSSMCFECHLPINALYVGSERKDEQDVYEKYFKNNINKDNYKQLQTTSSEAIKAFWQKTKEQNRHLVIVSTYQSFNKLQAVIPIDICTYDEAHTTTGEEINKNITTLKPNILKNYFFTATRKVRGKDKGMNDVEIYGEVLKGISPREMVDKGEIATPRVHAIFLDDARKYEVSESSGMLIKTVIDAFTKHEVKIKEDSKEPEALGAKLLISCHGSTELKELQESPRLKGWCKDNNIRMFSFSSAYGSFEDFESKTRADVYESLTTLKDDEKAILLHIDILTEGIDLPSITGVLLLRHLNQTRLLQSFGRALRLLKTDRDRFYKGLITPNNKTNYIKPYAYLILPMHFKEFHAEAQEMRDTIKEIYRTYGIPIEEFLPPESYDGRNIEELNPLTDPEEAERAQKEFPLYHIIEELVMESLKEKLPKDKYKRYDKVLGWIEELK